MTSHPKKSTKFWVWASVCGLVLSWRSRTPFLNILQRLFWIVCLSFFSVSQYASTFMVCPVKRISILWNNEKAQTSNPEQMPWHIDKRSSASPWQCQTTHCYSDSEICWLPLNPSFASSNYYLFLHFKQQQALR